MMASQLISPVNILDLTPARLKDYVISLGGTPAQSDVILKSVYRECSSDFAGMSGLDPILKQKLEENASLGKLELVKENVSADGQTRKLLFRLEDGRTVESALIFSRDTRTGRERRTVCVSSQVGCPVGCPFCATGLQGFERNLSAGEIIGQVMFFLRRFHSDATNPQQGKNRWLTNVVFMGMGEPLANYANTCRAIMILNSPKGLGLGIHQVTLSTSGLVPQIKQLTGERLQFQLAVSLHAANDNLRNRLVPFNKKFPLTQLISACQEYSDKTGRDVFVEYALFDGINDSLTSAEELVHLLEGLKCRINLITGNPTGADFRPASSGATLAFQKKLMAAGHRTMLRVSRGADIEAGCGQLRSRGPGNTDANCAII
jgi:23S rRNA (adenine2503-C2)-methyltransferase